MTSDIESIFKYQKPNRVKLLNYGFLNRGTMLVKEISVMQNQFNMVITVENDNSVKYEVIEIIETFFDQNAEEVKSFFTDKLQRLSKRWRETFSQESKASSKRSKTTRRTTRKQ